MSVINISDDESFDEDFQPSKKLAAKPLFRRVENSENNTVTKSNPKFERVVITDDESESTSDTSIKDHVSNQNRALQQVSSSTFNTNFTSASGLSSVQASSNSHVIHPPVLPKRIFRWGAEARKIVGAVKKRMTSPLENNAKKRSIYNGISEDEDDTSNSEDSIESTENAIKLPPTIPEPNKLMIAGVNVYFPLKPYSSQIAVMNALIRGCTKEEHALLESPTGSGKTLALLCGALAWQKHYAEQYINKYQDFLNQHQYALVNNYAMELEEFNKNQNTNQIENKNVMEEPKKVPKIYYGSRTHRQITQVIKELKRTEYSNVRMTILSSRDFTCLQKTEKNKTELCNELLDPIKKLGCPYNNELNKLSLSFERLNRMNFSSPWDVEDLYQFGDNLGACPYYLARNLMAESQIVFCPYNYLIDPSIRSSMQISLKDEIVILDEAHNIEDICRDSASATFKVDELVEIVKDCEHLNKNYDASSKSDVDFTSGIIAYCESFQKFIEAMKIECKEGTSDVLTSKCWTGEQLLELMDINHLSIDSHKRFKQAASKAIEHNSKAKDNANDQYDGKSQITMSLTNTTIRNIETIIFFIEMITSKEHATNFRALVKEKVEKIYPRLQNSQRLGIVSPGPRNHRVRMLEFLCMNPGVIFSSLAKSARSIILASGTLSPTSSFSSELDTKFPNMLHANHVIPKEQVFIKAISQGPNKIPLRATYANVNSWKFQDEVGQVLVDVCETVPYGVLVFFSSYTAMKTLTDRWWQNGTMTKLHQCKKVVQEPRINADLAKVMLDYRETIHNCADEDYKEENGITGAILFAVFRGKIAEGIDFSDNEARCVITLGIPYAVRSDPAVELKVNFNDKYSKEKNLLKGQEWYTVQAYRALNQALGRCIRHRNDWGAILLVDDRFLLPHNQSYLPNWVRSMWTNRKAHYNLREDLEKFVTERTKADADRLLASTSTT